MPDMNASHGLATYYLFDLAWYRDGLRHLFEVEPVPRYTLLYLHTGQASAAERGPVLVAPTTSEGREWLQRQVEEGIVIELQSAAELDVIEAHLRSLTHTLRDNGAVVLFRYADPRLYAGIHASLSDSDHNRLLGPLVAMSGRALGQPWALSQPSEAAMPYTPSGTSFRLTRYHERCLKAWRGQALLQPIAERHGLPLTRLAEWYQQMPGMGFTTEHARIQGCERLARCQLDSAICPTLCQEIKSIPGDWRTKLSHLEARFAERGMGERRSGRQPASSQETCL
ncbi:uncharacterized protein DUF4123 [Modicisalibacter xianhensis]|uniref:Uncharacterized protein DUF4123 n=1 Tax=Modicisalibacter xianhensis TaxID=442341 RepID=A0A4R8FXL6_9GAMM|nr:DUF4123 domain-containing protein [Halomonas xianhensis]TDX31735.1 uncharacterized protein DUF4123 [Halomonas xianhensis]